MIAGHKKQLRILQNIAKSGNISHAYLFSGQEKLGKKKIAFEFAKLLFCKAEKSPCGKCKDCLDIENTRHPDLIFIGSADGEGEIQIAQVREAIWKLSLKPYMAPYKIAIVDKCHQMNRESQNCFLKTLEEPKGKTILILITEYPDLLLPTISSRVERVRFSPVSESEIKKQMLLAGASEREAEKLSKISLGSPGKAIEYLKNPEMIAEQEKIIRDIIKIGGSDIGARFKLAKVLADSAEDTGGRKLRETLSAWANFFRDLMLSKASGLSKSSDVSTFDNYSISKIKKIIIQIQAADYLLRTTNASPKLALENLLLEV